MKKMTLVLLLAAPTVANAMCTPPYLTGNQYQDQQAQQMFNTCLQQERIQAQWPQQGQQQMRGGQINFGILNPNTPAQAANSFNEGRESAQRRQLQEQQLEIQRLQILKMQRDLER